jgi:hypothetical protein
MPKLAALVLLLLTSGCTHDHPVSAAEPEADPGVRTVAVPERTEGTAIVARVAVGPLPRGARVIVRQADGEVVGSISPYGMQAAASGGSYTIPIPGHIAAAKELRLRFEVHEDDAAPRAPREGEIAGVELFAVPVKH